VYCELYIYIYIFLHPRAYPKRPSFPSFLVMIHCGVLSCDKRGLWIDDTGKAVYSKVREGKQ
jgi:hypothetical protein